MIFNCIDSDRTVPMILSAGANGRNLPFNRLIKINFAADANVCEVKSRYGISRNSSDFKSPYLIGDSVTVPRMVDKYLAHRKPTNMASSFPLAVNIYKANSDELKLLKNNKKVKKSVLTLPNIPAPLPQPCTVSDMNDSEYCARDNDNRIKVKKRSTATQNRKTRSRGKDFEFYDRDARYCSQMNIDLDCSSTDIIKDYNGDGKGTLKRTSAGANDLAAEKNNPHDVWAVLRNINRFQFSASPPISQSSIITPKLNKGFKRRKNRKNMRVVETCHTEEFAYISSIEVDSKSRCSFSQSSSFDKVTVIDKQDEISKFYEEIEHNFPVSNKLVISSNNKRSKKNRNGMKISNLKSLPAKTNNFKELTYSKKKNVCDNISENVSLVVHVDCTNKDGINDNNNKLFTAKCNKNLVYTKNNDVIENAGENITSFDVNSCHHDIKDSLYKRVTPCQEKKVQQFDKSLQYDKCTGLDYEANQQKKSIGSGYSGSSKAAMPTQGINDCDKPGYDSNGVQQFHGITRVILNKGHNKAQMMKRPPYQVTAAPKLTQTDIKRRLTKLRFPIVILGKDQVSSTFEVITEPPSQFNGLDEKIWPYMLEWQCINGRKQKSLKPPKRNTDLNVHKNKDSQNVEKDSKVSKIINGNPDFKQSKHKEKKIVLDCTYNSKNKNEHKHRPISPADIISQTQQLVKPKPMQQLKDRMLKLLYKNSSIVNVTINSSQKDQKLDNLAIPKTQAIQTDIAGSHAGQVSSNIMQGSVISLPHQHQSLNIEKRPWARAKWASDFIDNVIKKIKAGVYYTHDSKLHSQKAFESKEAEIQTISEVEISEAESLQSIVKVITNPKLETLASIPGFDNALPALEIKTMNMTEIAVKHCLSNVLVQFDLTIPIKPLIGVDQSSTLIPLEVTESHTKIFKYKSSILNAMLPAELCTILPRIINDINTSNHLLALPSTQLNKTTSNLSTISEITSCETPPIIRTLAHTQPYVCMSPVIKRHLNGKYRNTNINLAKLPLQEKILFTIKCGSQLLEELKPHLNIKQWFEYTANPTILLQGKTNISAPQITSKAKIKIHNCKALQPNYTISSLSIIPAYDRFDFKRYVEERIISIDTSCKPFTQAIASLLQNNAITVNLIMKNVKYIFSNINGYSHTKKYPLMARNTLSLQNKTDNDLSKCIEYIPSSMSNNNEKKSTQTQIVSVKNNKIRRKRFMRLYKKCKSASHISGEKRTTPLNKISNLNDFFEVLGSGKNLANVFDSKQGHQIMASVIEMKSWTTEINPRQALLVVLLTNKKDTSSLLRFRPVLIQGIAMNRITRATELDMEIEVIERENLNRIHKYEGISYVPASPENQDNLLEELCWIAKNTASDYQKPFDESSEKLIKSLLAKRKKLNPSYLRVMARYVGLGLLKSPNKKWNDVLK